MHVKNNSLFLALFWPIISSRRVDYMSNSLNRNVIVEIPSEAHVVPSTQRVWVQKGTTIDKKGHSRPVCVTIGKAFSDHQMYPNSNYMILYPLIYAKAAKADVPVFCKSAGLYAAMLSIGEHQGIYDILNEAYGIQYANIIVDYCMFSILSRTNASELYPVTMKNHVLFSGELYDDSRLSRFFEHEMLEDHTSDFRKRWIDHCLQEYHDEYIWLCLDGSNDDCDAVKVNDAEQGENKTGTSKDIVGFMYAVSAKDGRPITYDTYRGGRNDCKEIYKMMDQLAGYGLKVKGVILDKGFATINVIRDLRARDIAFIIKLNKNTLAQQTMFNRYASQINMSFEHCVDDEGKMFGCIDEVQLFSKYPDKAYVGLFYDSENGRARASYLIKKIKAAQKTAIQNIKDGKLPGIPSDMSDYLDPVFDPETGWSVNVCLDKINLAIDKKGYSAIATSENITAEELNSSYHLRDVSEESYSLLKSQLGDYVNRTHFQNGFKSKQAVGFISSIYRYELMNIAIDLKQNTNVIIRELNYLEFFKFDGKKYVYSRTAKQLQLDILSKLQLTEDMLDEIAEYETIQENAVERNPVHKLPETRFIEKPKRGRKKQANRTVTEPKKKGRPKGSKNKKTIEKEHNKEQQTVKKKGRPKGSKNKKTIEREKAEEILRSQGILPPKRGKGRPKGSKNKPKNSENNQAR